MNEFQESIDFVRPYKKEWINPKTGKKISYIEYGNLKGKTVLLFHGILATGIEKATLLDAKELHVIMPYRPNYGDSDGQSFATLSEFKEWLTPFISYLNLNDFRKLQVQVSH